MGAGNIEKIAAEWEAPWTTFPAEFVVSTLSKAEEKVVHDETLPVTRALRGLGSVLLFTNKFFKGHFLKGRNVTRSTEDGWHRSRD